MRTTSIIYSSGLLKNIIGFNPLIAQLILRDPNNDVLLLRDDLSQDTLMCDLIDQVMQRYTSN